MTGVDPIGSVSIGSEFPSLKGPFSTYRLVQVADRMRTLGWPVDRVREQVYRPFIVAGRAAWVNTWGALRYGPGSIVRRHEGQDVFCDYGAPVLASEDGVIEFGTDLLGGRVARLFRPDGSQWYYAHLSDWNTTELSPGDHVESGDVIGFCGNSGNAQWSHPHVHFGWYQSDGEARDPMRKLVEWLHIAEDRALSSMARIAARPRVAQSWRNLTSDLVTNPFNQGGPLAWALQPPPFPVPIDANLVDEAGGDRHLATSVLIGLVVLLLYGGVARSHQGRSGRDVVPND